MKKRMQIVQENINRLKSLIELSKKTENYDQDMLKKQYSDLAVFQIELSKLIKEEWEETHERLDYGDDR